MSLSLAFAADGPGFVLGAAYRLRFFDRPERQRWEAALPGAAWAVNVSADGRYVVAALSDGTLRWYRTDKGREVLALFVHPDGERWIAWTPEGFFDAAPGAQALIGYHLNQGKDAAGEFVAAAQLTEQFLRPDLIAQRLGPQGDRRIAEAVAKVGDVRQVLAAGLPPEVELLSPATGEIDGAYVLKVRVKNRGGGVGKLIYRIDGVEVEGRPADIPGTPGDTVGRQFSLATGERVLTVAATNARGVESKPVPVKLTVRQRQEQAALHLVAVGVTNYYDGDLRLRYAADDALALSQAVTQRAAALFPRGVKVRTLTDAQATVKNIDAAVTELARDARPEDTFVLYLSGHGQVLDGKYYFLPYEIQYENEAALRSQGLSEDKLRDLFARMPAKALLLLDTCRSGEALKLAARAAEDKGAITRLMTTSQRAVIAASTSQGMALEGYEGHGVFTYALLNALDEADYDKDGTVVVDEIALHVRNLVPRITEEKFKHRQTPMRELHGAAFPVVRPAGQKPE